MRGLFFNAQPTNDIVGHPSGFDREYDSDDFNRYMGAFFGNGIFVRGNVDACKVTASGLALTVAPGIALVDGGQCHFEPGDGLTITQGDGLYSVMCRRNNAAAVRAFELVAVRGEEEYPAPVRDGDIYDLCLAHVQVEDGVATVTDTREDRELCGFAALTGQPPYYPPDEANLPYVLWLYVLGLPMTPEQVEAVEGNPSLMEIFNNSRLTLATKEEAEAGVDNSKIMTPHRTKEAIEKLAGAVKSAYGEKKYRLGIGQKLAKGFEPRYAPNRVYNTSIYLTPRQNTAETEDFFVWAVDRGIAWVKKDGSEIKVDTIVNATSGYTSLGISPIPGNKVYSLYGPLAQSNNAKEVKLYDLVSKTSTSFVTNPSSTANAFNGYTNPSIIGIDSTTFWAYDSFVSGGYNGLNLALYKNGVKNLTRAFPSDYYELGLAYYLDGGILYFAEMNGVKFRLVKMEASTGVILGTLNLFDAQNSHSKAPTFCVKDGYAYILEFGYDNMNNSPRYAPFRLSTINLDTMAYVWNGTTQSIQSQGSQTSSIGVYEGLLIVTVTSSSIASISTAYTIDETTHGLVQHSNWSSLFDRGSSSGDTINSPVTINGRPGFALQMSKGGVALSQYIRGIPLGDIVFEFGTAADTVGTGTDLRYPVFINDNIIALTNLAAANNTKIFIKSIKELEIIYALEVD